MIKRITKDEVLAFYEIHKADIDLNELDPTPNIDHELWFGHFNEGGVLTTIAAIDFSPSENIGFLGYGYTAPEFRKNGYCTEVVKHLISLLKVLDVEIVVFAKPMSQSLVEKLGFERPKNAAVKYTLKY